jgi:hypothetical protein
MTDTDFHKPDPGPLRAAAEAAELAQAASGLVCIDGCRLAGSDPLAPLARDIARTAGAGHDRRTRVRQLDGEPLCRATLPPGPRSGPLAARARHRRDAGREHGPGLVPRTSRRGHRGLASRQPRGQLRTAGLDHPDRSRGRPGARASHGPRPAAGGPLRYQPRAGCCSEAWCGTGEPCRAGYWPHTRRCGRPDSRARDGGRGPGRRTGLERGGPCGPGSGPGLRLTGTGDCRQLERRHQRRRSGRLPRQCPGGSAVV